MTGAEDRESCQSFSFLVVDDEEPIRRVISSALASRGHRVEVAQDGPEALRLYRQLRPDVVVADICMPGMDGIRLLEEIRSRDPDAEVVLITGYADKDVVIEALRRGASNFVEKPFRPSALISQLEPSLLRCGLRRENEALRVAIERERQRREAESRFEVMARLLVGLAREIQIPLELAASNAELLRFTLDGVPGEEAAEARRLAEELDFCARRIQGMIGDIEKFLSPSSGEVPGAVDVAEALEECLQAVAGARPEGVRLGLELPPETLLVACDPEDFRGCLVRILENAYEALGLSGGAVSVAVRVLPFETGRIGGVAEIEVADDGPGVPQGIIDEVFVPFFSTRQQGLGLGLSLAFEAARRNGGQLELQSAEGEGTRVTVRLPLAPECHPSLFPAQEGHV